MEYNTTFAGNSTGTFLIVENIDEKSKNLAKEVIEKLSPIHDGIRASDSSTERAISIIKEVFEI